MPSSLARRQVYRKLQAGKVQLPLFHDTHTCMCSSVSGLTAICTGRPESTWLQTWRHQLLARGRPALRLHDLHGTLVCHMVWLVANAADLTRSDTIREDSGCMEAGERFWAKDFVIFQLTLSTVPLCLPDHQPAVCQ